MAKALNVSELNNAILNTMRSKLPEEVFNFFGDAFGAYDVTIITKDYGSLRFIENKDGDSSFSIYGINEFLENNATHTTYAKLKVGKKKEFVDFLNSKKFELRGWHIKLQPNDFMYKYRHSYWYYTIYEVGSSNIDNDSHNNKPDLVIDLGCGLV